MNLDMRQRIRRMEFIHQEPFRKYAHEMRKICGKLRKKEEVKLLEDVEHGWSQVVMDP
jgi:hypothetical protein